MQKTLTELLHDQYKAACDSLDFIQEYHGDDTELIQAATESLEQAEAAYQAQFLDDAQYDNLFRNIAEVVHSDITDKAETLTKMATPDDLANLTAFVTLFK